MEKKCKKAKWLSEEALQIAVKRRGVKKKFKKEKWLSEEALQIAQKRSERQSKKGKIYAFKFRVPKNSKES